MKKIFPFLLFTSILLLVACGDDSNDYNLNNNKGKDTTSAQTDPRQSDGPDEAKYQLEFPALKGGGSEVIVHSTDADGMTYALEWDHQKKAQRWTCFKIYASNRVKRWSRSNWPNGDPFQYDPKVPVSEQPNITGEFSGSKYPGSNSTFNRGHICASEDRVYSKEANEQTFYMTNMMPQVSKFNSGIWSNMETRVRTWGNKVDTLYVCKGGTIDNDNQILTTTRSGFIVPKFFFMAILARTGNTFKAMGFWVEHLNDDHSKDNIKDYAIPINDLQKYTGIDFFCNLPDDIENEVENVSKSQLQKDWFN
jgi:endonuclease G